MTNTIRLNCPKFITLIGSKKDANDAFIWPGFGENVRVLEWIFNRCGGEADAIKTPIGNVPKSLNLSGTKLAENEMKQLFHVDINAWKKEVEEIKEYFAIFGDKLPSRIKEELSKLEDRLNG